MKRDKKNRFKFASLQSDFAQKMLERYNYALNEPNSIILLTDGDIYIESNAVLEICKHLRGFWPLLYVFRIFPKKIRDRAYQYIAKNRYRWFGKKEDCYIPTKEELDRFID